MRSVLRNITCLLATATLVGWLAPSAFAKTITADVCVYGASSAGIGAAIEVGRLGKTVVLVEPGGHLGGMNVEGLGGTDIDNHNFKNSVAVGGIAKEFYQRLGKAYGKKGPQYRFEPHVAEEVIDAWIAETPGITVIKNASIKENPPGVTKNAEHAITAIELTNGDRVEAKVYIDGSIEGDLLAAAGVSTVIGREANSQYGETKNGIRGETTHAQFRVKVDPYKTPGDPSSGVIPTIQDEPLGTPGEGDHRLQAYCFRLCFTKNPENRIPFTKPEGYDPDQYEIYLRYIKAGGRLFVPSAGLPNGKTDLGSWHDLSLNLYGMNFDYPGGDAATRERVLKDHLRFTQGLCYFLSNDPRVPEKIRKQWSQWGTCKDEFTDNGGWPRMFYVRDARRMVSDYVITENHTKREGATPVEDPVAVAYWPPDTHSARRIVRNGAAYNEGFVFGGEDWGPFGISYRSLVPRASECTNLLTAACPSSSHVAYGAIRIEFTFFAMGQATGAAAVMAIDEKVPVQKVDYSKLRELLIGEGQVVEIPNSGRPNGQAD